MKKILILGAMVVLFSLFSGCIGQKTANETNAKTVKIGDSVAVDYIAYLNGKIVDTSTESIAKENNLSDSNRKYSPIKFIVGKGGPPGLGEGIIGMKVGESKTLTIPQAYGQKNPRLIQSIPIIQNIPVERNFSKVLEIPIREFNSTFGSDHKVNDNIRIPDSTINLTILNISYKSVYVSYNLAKGEEIVGILPWKEIVINIDKNITVRSEAKKGDIVQLKDIPWNSTVIDVDSENITLRHNKIQDTKITISNLGTIRIHFNETHVIMDMNNEYAGETIIFNVTVKSIN